MKNKESTQKNKQVPRKKEGKKQRQKEK